MKIYHVLEAIKQAFGTRTTVYDCSYHYAAILLNGTFVTCDKAYTALGLRREIKL